jgi:hypothetical protein
MRDYYDPRPPKLLRSNSSKKIAATSILERAILSKQALPLVVDKDRQQEDEAATKVQKVFKGHRTRRSLADCAIVVEELWWSVEALRLGVPGPQVHLLLHRRQAPGVGGVEVGQGRQAHRQGRQGALQGRKGAAAGAQALARGDRPAAPLRSQPASLLRHLVQQLLNLRAILLLVWQSSLLYWHHHQSCGRTNEETN